MMEQRTPESEASTSGIAFTYDALPSRVVFGLGAVGRVAEELSLLGARRVLVIATTSMKRVAALVAHELGDRVVDTFTEVRQHVPEGLARSARRTAHDGFADTVLTIGGGSATGLGKAVSIETGALLVAVPTTYAGSEVTPIFGITGDQKRTGRDMLALPRLAVYDPELTVGLPPRVTAASGFNALAHGVEALYAPNANPVSTLHATEAIHVLARALPVAVSRPDDVVARAWALYGAFLAGTAFASAGTALHHKLCHVLGGDMGLVHADLHAVLLPHVTAFNAVAAPQAMADVAAILGARDAARALHELARQIGAPTSLAEIGMPERELNPAARRAAEEAGEGNPRPVDVAAVRMLLDDAYYGREPRSAG